MVNDTVHERWQESKVCQQMDAGVLQEVLPPWMVDAALEEYGAWESRERKLNMRAMVYWAVGLHLYPTRSQTAVYDKLVSNQRRMRDDVAASLPSKGAFAYRRQQLGSEVLHELWEGLAAPPTPLQTPGVSWKGLRLWCLDGTRESVPDTLENALAFQYSTNDPTVASPFPQVRLVYLIECGTHLIKEWEMSSCREGELTDAARLLPRVDWHGILLLWDSGFHSHHTLFQVHQAGGHVLGRLKARTLLHPFARLTDGSVLVEMRDWTQSKKSEPLVVRVISYELKDERMAGGKPTTYRLVTTLLDPVLYPAEELIEVYHQRWHAELTIGETRTTMRLCARTLRSQTPQGVIQEVEALVLAHTVVRTLMRQAGQEQQQAPTRLSFKRTLELMDTFLPEVAGVSVPRRQRMLELLRQEIAQHPLPARPVRVQARVLKRAAARYPHKKPGQWKSFTLDDGEHMAHVFQVRENEHLLV